MYGYGDTVPRIKKLMNKTMKNIYGTLLMAILTIGTLLCAASCGKHGKPSENRKVMIMMSLGYNSISGYLQDDIKDLQAGYVPGNGSSADILLLYSKQTKKYKDYSTPSESALIRIYKNKKNVVVMDTLKTYPSTKISTSPETMHEVLSYIQQEFKARSYGIVYSSHGTGWLPAGYYANPSKYESKSISPSSAGDRTGRLPAGAVPYVEIPQDPSLPAVKTFGQEVVSTGSGDISYETEIEDFAAAIPMHLDYLLVDACLMGGIEVAYALKDVTDVIGFSQTEILAEGFDYRTITKHLLQGKDPDPVSVCKDYFDYYNNMSTSSERSATISIVDCGKLDALASVAKNLFEKYRSEIASVNPSKVQGYFRNGRHWFYDLEDILIQSGASESDIKALSDAISASILYKGATPSFLDAFDITHFSGYSMYLPCNGSEYLDNFYRTISWNKATALVPAK